MHDQLRKDEFVAAISYIASVFVIILNELLIPTFVVGHFSVLQGGRKIVYEEKIGPQKVRCLFVLKIKFIPFLLHQLSVFAARPVR